MVELRERCKASERWRVSVRIRMLVVSVVIDCPATRNSTARRVSARKETHSFASGDRSLTYWVVLSHNHKRIGSGWWPRFESSVSERARAAWLRRGRRTTSGRDAGACAAPASVAKFTRFGRFESHDAICGDQFVTFLGKESEEGPREREREREIDASSASER